MVMRILLSVILWGGLALTSVAWAADSSPKREADKALIENPNSNTSKEADKIVRFSQPDYESRYYRLVDELRCPKCQNQNLADSNAPIAVDLKLELTRLLEEAKSDQEILDFMTLRYGDFVLYKPRVSIYTISLWVLPAIVLLLGLFVMLSFLRKGRSQSVMHHAEGEVKLNAENPSVKNPQTQTVPVKTSTLQHQDVADEDLQKAVDELLARHSSGD